MLSIACGVDKRVPTSRIPKYASAGSNAQSHVNADGVLLLAKNTSHMRTGYFSKIFRAGPLPQLWRTPNRVNFGVWTYVFREIHPGEKTMLWPICPSNLFAFFLRESGTYRLHFFRI